MARCLDYVYPIHEPDGAERLSDIIACSPLLFASILAEALQFS